MSLRRVIISGGGTGGHIFPAIAIADEIKKRNPDAEILFVGAKGRMEMTKVPEAGYPIKGLWISGIQRKLTFKNLSFPFKLISSLWNAGKIIRTFKPEVAIGVGGYASGPLLRRANSKNIKTVLQEQNSFPGITNKWLSAKADKICVAYDGLERWFPKEKIIKTGNPVRALIREMNVSKEDAQKKFNLDKSKLTILAVGGSLGARTINQALIEISEKLVSETSCQIVWQTGSSGHEEVLRNIPSNLKDVHILQFIKEMDKAYAAADIIISRAGAMSISELCLVGKPVILIPSPNVSEDHQTKNAKALSDRGAAVLVKDSEAKTELEPIILDLLSNESKRNLLSEEIRKMALPSATSDIVNQIESLFE